MSLSMRAMQRRVSAWVSKCFGDEALFDERERAMRVLEESLELAQSCGVELAGALKAATVVYGRPPGRCSQEIAGVGIALLAMAECETTALEDAIGDELFRIEMLPVDHFCDRQREKAKLGISREPA